MPNTNIVILEGHLGKDPEAKTLQSGVVLCNVSLATSTGPKDKQKTQWHSLKIFGSAATDLALNAKKGDVVSLKGSIEYQEYNGKWFTNIIVDHLHVTKKRAKQESEFEPE